MVNVWPVLAREVREAARQPSTYRARMIAALAVLGSGFMFMLQVGSLGPGEGGQLFTWLHLTVFFSTWMLVPMIAADCLSRERREGTLGLLFLTPLRAIDVVLAKLSSHALRGLLLWGAAIPVFTIPILVGGVPWQQAVAALSVNLSALMLSLAATVLASAFSKKWTQAVIWSYLLGFCLLIFWLHFLGSVLLVHFNSGRTGYPIASFDSRMIIVGIQAVADWARIVEHLRWGRSMSAPLAENALLVTVCLTSLISVLVLAISCGISAWITRRGWQEEPPSALRASIERGFTTPILAQDLLKRWLRHALNSNPVGWLERRSWSGRLVMFGWLAIAIGVFSGLVPQVSFWRFNMRRYDFDLIDILLAEPLLLSMAASAAGSFRRERETGVLELLLVSPLSASSIVWGRIRGIYAQFMPSVVLILIGWIFLLTLWPDLEPDQFRPVIRFVAWSLAVPSIGLCASLITRNFIAAFITTLLFAWGVPWVLAVGWASLRYGLHLGIRFGQVPPALSLLPAVVCLAVAGGAVWVMIRRLDERRFQFNREVT